MTSSATKIALLAGSLTLAAVGCATPTADKAGPSWMPGGHVPQMPGGGMIPSTPGYSATAPQPQLAAEQPAVAQVGFFTPARTSDPCGACPAPPSYTAPPSNWNAYGLDPQEFICDGGDHPPRAIVRRDNSVGGLQLEDTVVHYTTENGDIELQASNRACVYSPRFISVRQVTGAVAGGRAIGLAQVDRPESAGRFDTQLPGLVMTDSVELGHADVARRIDSMRERNRGVPVEGVLQPEMAADVMAALAALSTTEMSELRDTDKALLEKFAVAAIAWSLDDAPRVVIEDLRVPTLGTAESLHGFTIYEYPDAGRLQIGKFADRNHALPGEIVSFMIKVENVGDSPVEDVVLVDNLTARLEYVEGSQTCSGGAEFETSSNEGESLKLQWKLTDKLRVGESVTIRFQCKVR